MKKWIFILPFLFLSLWTLGGENELVKQAETFYREGKYLEAADVYNKVLASGEESYRLYYNLGNCYYKLGENTKAILNYERALLLHPGDRDARYNLKMAQNKTVDKIEVLPELFVVRWYKTFVAYFSADQWAYISVGFFLLFLAMSAVFFYSTSIGFKKLGFIIGVVALLLTVMSVVFTVRQNGRIEKRDYAIVLTPSVTVKGAPDNSGTSLFVVHEGLKVQIIGSLGDWVNIRLQDGNEGWVTNEDVERI